ncbi:hypothetical protein U1Q18_050641 [Sarracenia purpurea var. burkii]
MALLDLFVAASNPVAKVLLVTAVGSFLALDHINILGEDTRKHMNNQIESLEAQLSDAMAERSRATETISSLQVNRVLYVGMDFGFVLLAAGELIYACGRGFGFWF